MTVVRTFFVYLALMAAANAVASPLPRGMHLRARAGLAYDTNALRLHDGTVDTGFLPYALDLTYDFRPGARWRARIESRLAGNAYFEPVPSARSLEYDLRLRITRRVLGGRIRRTDAMTLDLQFLPYAGYRRSIYTSRRSGHEILVTQSAHDGLPPQRVSLAGRYDSRDLGAEVVMTLQWPRGTVWDLEYDYRARDYTNDYPFVARTPQRPLSRYDYEDWAIRFRVSKDIGHGFSARLRYWYERKDYLDRASRDPTGAPIMEAGYFQGQRFLYDVVRCELRWRGKSVDASVGSGWSRRDDPAWGYFDSTTLPIDAFVRWWRGPLELHAAYEYTHIDYRSAHVEFNNLRPLLDDYPRSMSIGAEYQALPSGSVFARLSFDTADEANPVFAYERWRGTLGYEVRY